MVIHDEMDRNISDGDQLNDGYFNALATLVPIGAIIPWAKSFTSVPALPDGWVECDGSAISDAASPLDGETTPDLNGNNQFIRGNSTSGGTGGVATNDLEHDHGGVTGVTGSVGVANEVGSAVGVSSNDVLPQTISNALSSTTDNKPPYMDMVFIMRIK